MLNAGFWGASEITRTGWSRRAICAELTAMRRDEVEVDILKEDLLTTVGRPAPRACHVNLAAGSSRER